MQVRGLHLHATRAGSAALGSGRLPAGTGTWRVRYGDLPGRWYRARVASARTGAVLYLHGGGFVWGSPRSHRALASWLSHHARMPVFLPHYRRAPEHPYPAAADDALAAYLALLDRGMAPAQITVAGDSAGGHLVATLLRTLAQHGLPFPAAAALFSPFLDLTCAGMRARDLRTATRSFHLPTRSRPRRPMPASWRSTTPSWM